MGLASLVPRKKKPLEVGRTIRAIIRKREKKEKNFVNTKPKRGTEK